MTGSVRIAIIDDHQIFLDGIELLIADMDMRLVTKRKRMMDSVGHYSRPELLHLVHDARPARPVHRIEEIEESVSHSETEAEDV